jgi:DNA repair exonuclease SbcCD ATPase subunit
VTLTRLEIRNFQSLKKVDLDLGDFTVIVGASSSGKSALIRACKALASNVRGSGIITRGQKLAAITARTDTHTITLERSATAGAYRINDNHGNETVFTKLNGEVPATVTELLRVAPVPANGTSINFANQFDKPYLLDESGATVAARLAELTNVNVIFDAVRQANKVRLAASRTLKTRQDDLAALRPRLGAFAGLSGRLNVLDAVEAQYEQVKVLTGDITRLESALQTLDVAERALSAAAIPAVPDPAELNTALNRLLDLVAKVRSLGQKNTTLAFAVVTHESAQTMEDNLRAELATVLADARVCPTCGQATA